jgi:MFS family permease
MSSSLLLLLSASFTWQRLIPLILRDYGASDFHVSLALGAISIGHALPQVIGGIVADRWGRRAAIVFPGVAAVGFYLMMSLTRSWQALAALIFCNRVMGAIQAPSFAAILAESVPRERRGMAFAVFQVATGLGCTIGPIIGALLMKTFAMHLLMVVNAAALAVATAMRWFWLSETAWGDGPRPAEQPPLTWADLGRSARTVWAAVMTARGRAILGAGTLFVLIITMTVQGPFIPLYAQDRLGMDKAQVNLMFSAGPLVAIGVSLLGGRLIGRWGPRIILLLGIAGFAPLLGSWLGAPSFAAGMWSFTLAYVFLQVAIIAHDTLRTELVEGQGRGLALGILGAVTGAVAALGPPAAGWLQARMGALTPFWMTYLAAAALLLLLAADLTRIGRELRASRHNV